MSQEEQVVRMQTEVLLEYLILAIVALIGSFSKEYLRIMKCNDSCLLEDIKWSRVFLSTFTSFILVYSFSDYLTIHIGYKVLTFCSFVMGLLGFQLLEKMATIEGLRKLIGQAIEILKLIEGKGTTLDREGRGSRRSTNSTKTKTKPSAKTVDDYVGGE